MLMMMMSSSDSNECMICVNVRSANQNLKAQIKKHDGEKRWQMSLVVIKKGRHWNLTFERRERRHDGIPVPLFFSFHSHYTHRLSLQPSVTGMFAREWKTGTTDNTHKKIRERKLRQRRIT